MADKKLCPFKTIQTGTDHRISDEIKTSFGYCEEEKCAMWIKENITNYRNCPTADITYIGYCGLSNHRTR